MHYSLSQGRHRVIKRLQFCRQNNIKSSSAHGKANLNRDNFVDFLGLSERFEAKKFEGMNRVHFKYDGIGFAVIEMKRDCYNLRTRESYLDDIGVNDYDTTQHHHPNSALIRDIPYSDADILFKLIKYVSGKSFNAGSFVKQELISEEQRIENEFQSSNLVGSDKIALVKARVNQGVFRERLVRQYGKCCLCGVDEESLLIASHIKPWVESSPEERVDENNGLLLCPNHDRLFDRGFITFNDDGTIKISQKLSENSQIFMNVNSDIRIDVNPALISFMKYHRERIFIDSEVEEAAEKLNLEIDAKPAPDAASEITPLQATKLGPLPDSLIGFEVEHVGYGDGIIKSIDSRSFQIEVKFEDHEEPKTFVFPGCFLSGKLTLKKDEDQLGLEEHLKKYKF